jgi:RNA polymerase sigma-70 factor (ECF subfamily)
LDDLRRARVRSASIFAETVDPDTVAAESGNPLLAGEFADLLQVVSSDEREIIILRVYEMLTFQEIADLRNVPLSTVTSWYRRGLGKIRSALGKEAQ